MWMLSYLIVCSVVRLFEHIRNSLDKVQYHSTVQSRTVRLLFLEQAPLYTEGEAGHSHKSLSHNWYITSEMIM
jgi:hypothetical protein